MFGLGIIVGATVTWLLFIIAMVALDICDAIRRRIGASAAGSSPETPQPRGLELLKLEIIEHEESPEHPSAAWR